jgi:hypothetical protein
MEFLSPDNVAGQTLLNLVARGSAIVAELLRLSDHIPSVFVGSDPQEAAKYAPILIDLRYLKSPQLYDEKIDSVQDVVEMDEEFRDNHLPLLERFYKMFESIFKVRARARAPPRPRAPALLAHVARRGPTRATVRARLPHVFGGAVRGRVCAADH